MLKTRSGNTHLPIPLMCCCCSLISLSPGAIKRRRKKKKKKKQKKKKKSKAGAAARAIKSISKSLARAAVKFCRESSSVARAHTREPVPGAFFGSQTLISPLFSADYIYEGKSSRGREEKNDVDDDGSSSVSPSVRLPHMCACRRPRKQQLAPTRQLFVYSSPPSQCGSIAYRGARVCPQLLRRVLRVCKSGQGKFRPVGFSSCQRSAGMIFRGEGGTERGLMRGMMRGVGIFLVGWRALTCNWWRWVRWGKRRVQGTRGVFMRVML